MAKSGHLLKRIADNIAASMLAAMFLVFLLQIFARYLLNVPIGWTVEVCLTLWVWLVFWASGFCLGDEEHIRFDMLYLAMPRKVQRVLSAAVALIIMGTFAYSFLPTLDYITFYKIKKSAILRIRLDYIFSIYGVFILAIVVRYGCRAVGHINPGFTTAYRGEDRLKKVTNPDVGFHGELPRASLAKRETESFHE